MAGHIDNSRGDWPDELWYFDPSRWCRHKWLDAALEFAKQHGYKKLPIIQAMTTDYMELPATCREKRPGALRA
jgi:hypothetical protein